MSGSKESSTNCHTLGQYTSFDQIIGHEVFIKMLKAAINKPNIHSFMFSGTRGIGKTSMARILARSIICNTHNICNICPACIDNIDITEIDAATYTGVDNIREIIEQSTFKPIIAQNKVFIIDEAHMLSKSAFNALLKTIEEPSESAYFIFATTEIQKIPRTLISRCLTCNLQPLSVSEIEEYMRSILVEDDMRQYSNDTLRIMAQKAKGSIREAKFILEKASLIGTNNLRDIFGFLPCDVEQIISYIKQSQYQQAIEILNNIHSSDPLLVLHELADAIYQSDIHNERKVYVYNIAINTIPLLKHYNDLDVVKVAVIKMCLDMNTIDILVERAKKLFPDLQLIQSL